MDIFSSQVVLLGMDILSALVNRLQEKFRTQVGTGEVMVFNNKQVVLGVIRIIQEILIPFNRLLVLPSLMDRLGDAKDQVRDQDQALLLKIMDQAANPQVIVRLVLLRDRRPLTFRLKSRVCPFQYVWERMMGGFKHKNNRTREGLCLCLISTLNV